MKLLPIIALFAALSVFAEDTTPFHIVDNQTVRLPLDTFPSRSEYERILTRKDQLIRAHSGNVGMGIRRLMSPVRNQGARGTCNVFAAVSLIEAFTGEDYSEQCLAKMSSNRDPGVVEERLEYVRRNGIYYERDCPYDSTQRDNIPNLSQARVKQFDGEFEAYPFRGDDPIAFIKSRLAVSSAVAVSLFVVGRQQWMTGPFLYMPNPETIALECGFQQSCAGHAIVVTGLNDLTHEIEFKNSWGTHWGQQGYGYMSYEYMLTFGKNLMVSY